MTVWFTAYVTRGGFAWSCVFFLLPVTQVGHSQPLSADPRPLGPAQVPRSLQAVCRLLPVQRGKPVAGDRSQERQRCWAPHFTQWALFIPQRCLISRRSSRVIARSTWGKRPYCVSAAGFRISAKRLTMPVTSRHLLPLLCLCRQKRSVRACVGSADLLTRHSSSSRSFFISYPPPPTLHPSISVASHRVLH